MKLILASASPRRQALLEMLQLEFSVLPAQGEEDPCRGMSPAQTVSYLSHAKAKEVSKLCHTSDVIIGADTVVSMDEEILGKPRDENHALEMLQKLSGRTHIVYTGVTVLQGDTVRTAVEITEVDFRPLQQKEMLAYIRTGEPMDKAGAYGIQGLGSAFVSGIRGDYFNVVGLPLFRLQQMLAEVGIRTF